MPEPSPQQLGNALVILAAFAVLVYTALGIAVKWRDLRSRDRSSDPVTRAELHDVRNALNKVTLRAVLLKKTLDNGIKTRVGKLESQMEQALYLLNRLQTLLEKEPAHGPGKTGE